MNRNSLALLFIHVAFFVFAQENPDTETASIEDKKHEIKADGMKLLAGPILEVTYEYVHNNNSGFGTSILVDLQSNSDYLEAFSITPFYRAYFFNKQDFGAKGFFVEGHGKYATGEDPIFTTNEGRYTDFSLGLSVGQKWVNKNGFIAELLLGFSRTLGNNSGHDVYFRGGVFLGYRL